MASASFSLPNLSSDNISLYILPLIWVNGIWPRQYGQKLYARATNKTPDVVQPRNWTNTVTNDPALDQKTRMTILRCEGALNNGHENFPIIAAALVAGNAAGLRPELLNGLTLGYLASRVAYNFIYIWQDTPAKAALRSTVWSVGVGIWITLFVKAGGKFAQAAL